MIRALILASLVAPAVLRAVTPQATVVVSNFSFNPQATTINVGNTVEWDNTGGFHSATSNDGTTFNQPAASSPWTYQFTFSSAGVYQYYCTVHGNTSAYPGCAMCGIITVNAALSPTVTPTLTPTPSFSESPTFSVTLSSSPSNSPSPSFTQTPSITFTPTISNTFTPVPAGSSPTVTPSDTPTVSPSPTSTSSPSVTPPNTATLSPINTLSSTPTPTGQATPPIQFRQIKAALAPVPAVVGQPVCLYLDGAPQATEWNIYNIAGDRVVRLIFRDESPQCWDAPQAAAGVYFVRVDCMMKDGSRRQLKQKIAFVNK